MPNFEKPILFSETMVNAILDGRKSQTRRVMKPQPECKGVLEVTPADEVWYIYPHGDDGEKDHYCKFPYAHRLWVRENFAIENDELVIWKADRCAQYFGMAAIPINEKFYLPSKYQPTRWRPSIHMPRWACRLLLDIVRIRVERLQDITEADCVAEGIAGRIDLKDRFSLMWDEINASRGFGWSDNPYVWVIDFKNVQNQPKSLDKTRWEMEYLNSWEVRSE